MSNEIVKYNNDISDLPLRGFTASELNVLMSLFYRCKDKETQMIELDYKELKSLSQYAGKSNKRFMEELHSMATKLHQLSFDEDKGNGKFKLFHFFETFEATDKSLNIRVNKDFTYLINKLEFGNYTSFELEEINFLRSTYSKNAYRLCKRFKDTGWWKVTIEDFRRLLDIPETYKAGDITKKVILPIAKELPAYFEDFKVDIIKDSGVGKKIWGYSFKWSPEKRKEPYKPRYIKKLKVTCPKCGEPLYELENSKGFLFIGHKDGWDNNAKCNATFGTITEAMGLSELPSRENPNVYENINVTSKEQQENIDKINSIAENLFK